MEDSDNGEPPPGEGGPSLGAVLQQRLFVPPGARSRYQLIAVPHVAVFGVLALQQHWAFGYAWIVATSVTMSILLASRLSPWFRRIFEAPSGPII